MPACFTIIGSIASTTRKFVNNIRAQAIGLFIFELKKIGNTCWWFKNNSSFTKGKVLLILFFNRVLKSSDNLPRNGKTITKSFFPAVNVTGFSLSLLLRKLLMQLSISLIGNAFFYNISVKWHTSNWNLEKSKTIEIVRNNKVKIKPTLYSSKMNILH